MAKALMIQGTASHVGKSVLVTALCRLFSRWGLRVAPFKAQNMALNSFVTADGCEIGWAQAVQAQAAGLLPQVDFNPILLKPTADQSSQVIVQGKPLATMSARQYEKVKPRLWKHVAEAFDRLARRFDLILIEGAGSPAEINLKAADIVNMRMAQYAKASVLLVADIDRGGVFASLLGTLKLLTPSERKRVRGLLINKFRGDPKILRPGLRQLERLAKKSVLGVLPYFPFSYQDQEDSVALETACSSQERGRGKIKVAVIRTPRISNFTDMDSLRYEPCVDLRFVQHAAEWDSPDLVILPGSKNTLEDLHFLKQSGLAQKICAAAQQGTFVLGICGGYQMLGRRLEDPHGVESARKSGCGLGLLDVETVFYPDKSLHQVNFRVRANGSGVMHGYEIHVGQTVRDGDTKPLLEIIRRSGLDVRDEEGTINPAGNVLGTYVHGLLANDEFRHSLIQGVARRRGITVSGKDLLQNYEKLRMQNWDRLADWLADNCDMAALCRIAGVRI